MTLETVVEELSPEMLEIIEKRMTNLRKSAERFYSKLHSLAAAEECIICAVMTQGLLNHMAREFEVLEINGIAVPKKITFEFNKICEEFHERSYRYLP